MNRRVNKFYLIHVLVGLILSAASSLVLAEQEQPSQQQAQIGNKPSSSGDQSLNVELLDLDLLDQNAKQIKFASEAIASKIVALNFVYTSCNTTCPLITAIFANLQKKLGDRLGQQVRLVSLSINSMTDTPARLKEYADRFHAGPDWIWLTGDKQHVEKVLKGLGVYTADYAEHPPTILVGDAEQNTWFRFNGLPSPNQIAAKIDTLLVARSNTVSQTKE